MSRISVEVGGQTHFLTFGMDAYEIVIKLSIEEFEKSQLDGYIKNTPTEELAIFVYAGIFNEAIARRNVKPSFTEAYDITSLLAFEDVDNTKQSYIWNEWKNSLAGEKVSKMLEGLKKKDEPKSRKTSNK